MSNLRVCTESELKAIEKNRGKYMGFLCVIDMGNGYVKISATRQPYAYFRAQTRNVKLYEGDGVKCIAISPQHTNYQENKKIVLRNFDDLPKVGTDMFLIGIDSAINRFEYLNLQFEDKTKEIEQKSINFCKGMQNTLASLKK